ncbi:MAG TPA: endonuclease/exonuclease/phosphatase family protein, partial [Micavibrio sp.]
GGRARDGKRDLLRIHALMEERKIDIAVFQEMETRQSRGGRESDAAALAGNNRPYRLPGPNKKDDSGGWYGNLLVSRYPIMRALIHNLETAFYLEPRSAIDALIDTPLGKIRIIGTHLSLSPSERFSEGKNLVRLMNEVEEEEKNPVFLMGDMNEWRRNSRLLRYMNQILTPVRLGPTFPSFRPIFELDRVWHDRGLDVRAEILLDPAIRVLSDHLPVVIELSRLD